MRLASTSLGRSTDRCSSQFDPSTMGRVSRMTINAKSIVSPNGCGVNSGAAPTMILSLNRGQGTFERPFRSSQKSIGRMSLITSRAGQAPRPSFSKARSVGAGSVGVRAAPARMSGSAVQKQAHWLSRAADAERAGDPVEAELCRQYAEHWFRVSRGQD